MNLKIHTDSETPQASRQRPPDYFSRSAKLRLATLVTALGLVFLMMNEARKPSTWERLGFRATLVDDSDPSENVAWLESEHSVNVAGTNAIEQADRKLLESVTDRSSMNRSAEAPAWNRTWQRVLNANSHQRFEPVTFIQLNDQPDAFRGQFIKIDGSVRGVEKIELPENHKLGIRSYKVLWIKPASSNQTPYCVYANELPDDFPEPTSGFLKIKENVSVQGIFFKLRSYQAANGSVEICPLIVANTVRWQPAEKTAAAKKWSPPAWLITIFFIGMPLIAAWLAWRVFKSTRSTPFLENKRFGTGINETLTALSSDPDVKSDHEKVMELYNSKRNNDSD